MENTKLQKRATVQRYDPEILEKLVTLATAGVDSEHTRRNYDRSIRDFAAWWQDEGLPRLNLQTVQRYKDHMTAAGFKAGNMNLRLSAIRRMIRQAAAVGLITDAERVSALQVQGKKGTKGQGHWLSREEASRFLSALPADTLAEIRDRALVSLALGSGLRRSELSALTVDHFTKREGRWIILDIVGKRNKARTVPIADWVKAAVDEWLEASGIVEGVVFRRITKGGRLLDGPAICPHSIRRSLARAIEHARERGADVPKKLAPHDLRRTFAQLARKGGATLEQIAHSLGHESIATTEKYLGIEQDLQNAPSDLLGISLELASRGMHAGRSMYL
jgi:site-specific recombinase XerD